MEIYTVLKFTYDKYVKHVQTIYKTILKNYVRIEFSFRTMQKKNSTYKKHDATFEVIFINKKWFTKSSL